MRELTLTTSTSRKNGNGTLTATVAATYDMIGNGLTVDGPLAGTADTSRVRYDAMRLRQVTAAATTQFAYDGLAMIAEYDGAGALLRRFVHGPGSDEPLVQYEGTGTTDRRWLHADERGSVVAISDGGGNAITINRYDEYGKPQATNAGRFGYTGQMWLGEVGLNYYKARMYAPQLGRFLQTDPIGAGGGINLYAYVGNDPVDGTDPTGLDKTELPNPNVKPINPGEAPPTGCLVNAECGIAGGMSGNWPVSNGVGGPVSSNGETAGYAAAGVTWTAYRRDIYSDGSRGSWQYAGSWSSSDFVFQYYFGGGSTVDLGKIGLGERFKNSPSVKGSTDAFKWRILYHDNRPFFTAHDIDYTDVTDDIFSVVRSAFYRDAFCSPGSCVFTFGINDAFRNPLNIGSEVGGIPYPIRFIWSETLSRPKR